MFGDGVAIFLGIVAGAVVQLGLNTLSAWTSARRARKEAAFELDYILHTKMPQWRTHIAELRRLVGEGRGSESFGYLDMTAVSFRALGELMQTRQAYDLLGRENLGKLFEVNAFMIPAAEQYWNQRAQSVRTNPDRTVALRDLDFFDWKFRDIADKIAAVRAKLPGRSQSHTQLAPPIS